MTLHAWVISPVHMLAKQHLIEHYFLFPIEFFSREKDVGRNVGGEKFRFLERNNFVAFLLAPFMPPC